MKKDAIKNALKMIPYGFFAVTSRSDDDENAMVANWITQISFEPRLLALGLQRSSHTRSVIEQGRVFALNIFNIADKELMMPFTKGRSRNPDKMNDAHYKPAPVTGCPVLEGATAYIEFEVTEIINPGGDHDIVIGKPVGAEVLKPGEVSEMLTLPAIGWSYAG